MQVNYYEIGIVVLLAVAVLIWLIVRNRKDKDAFEKDELTDTIGSADHLFLIMILSITTVACSHLSVVRSRAASISVYLITSTEFFSVSMMTPTALPDT
jgi:predicted metal-binding membrane protein